MLHALRNLIAFVFLGGIFWFIYRAPENLDNPRFQVLVGLLVTVFALFWLFVPRLVVKMRIIRRNAKNRRGYAQWINSGRPLNNRAPQQHWQTRLEKGERILWHEKGTLYVEAGRGLDDISVAGYPGDVAFPEHRQCRRKIQRVHFYLTDKRIFFFGKALDLEFTREELAKFVVTPGGIVFLARSTFSFTFANPLVLAELVGTVFAR